ncbi:MULTISPECIES: hypothetical protein [unclassified Mycolicibacterium]|uniref:hypothetical protein n=1 Tax=unclassified Mycolicibacterium TaxID=2636767 RepID=UPI002EDAB0E3
MSIRGLSAAFGLIVLFLGTAVADTGTSNGATYAVSSTAVDPGNGWKLEVGQISGGDGAVTAAFNAAGVASGITVPWSRLTDVLAPGMQVLAR